MDNPTRFPNSKPEGKKKTLYSRFADFLRKYRVVVFAFFGVAILVVLGVFILTEVKSATVKDSSARLEKLDADFATYSEEQDAVKKADLEKALLATADDLVRHGPRLYAAQKALVYKAKIAASKKDWATAEKEWLAIATAVPESYLAPVALEGAATSAEELGVDDRAIADYKKLIDKYGSTAIGIPHAYFALGRIAERQKDNAAALVSYQKIVSSWPDDDWTKLATNRIIFIKSKGLSK